MKISLIYPLIVVFFLSSCTKNNEKQLVTSPDNSLKVEFALKAGMPYYRVIYKENIVIDTSFMGFEFTNSSPLADGFSLASATISSFSESWEMPWGEQRTVENKYNQLSLNLVEETEQGRKLNVKFRLYDDGVGFRYEFPEQANLSEILIAEENTEFNIIGDHKVWWIPGDWDIYEHLYNETLFSEIDAIAKRDHPNLAQTTIPNNAVNTPVTMKTADGLYLSFHEAALTNYSGMTLGIDKENLAMKSMLVGSANTEYKVKIEAPATTPWRTIQISERAGDLIESNLIVNLNEPNVIGDVSWFTPMKYIGIWWEMHLGKSTWDMESSQDMNSFTTEESGGGTHGATTENAKRYIDFAAENGIKGLLVEGWNTGWDRWIGFPDREGVFDFITPYADYDIKEVVRYGNEKGVELIMHHETSAAIRTYEQQQDTAFALMNSLGIRSVKTGYVGKIIPDGEYHHGQRLIQHYHNTLVNAAKNKVAINAHEPIKGTGKRRTYPNAISREGLRGQEFNAWSSEGGNSVDHLTTVAFTRMLAGPIDYTPGIFNLELTPYKDGVSRVKSTLANQLGLYVVIYSPIQMAADLPEHYEGQPAFQFIRDVGVDWEQSLVLDGEPADFVVIARQERETMNWFVGGIADENGKMIDLNFDFLEDGVEYNAIVYKDGEGADWETNPYLIDIKEMKIKKGDNLQINMASGGGFAISLMK